MCATTTSAPTAATANAAENGGTMMPPGYGGYSPP